MAKGKSGGPNMKAVAAQEKRAAHDAVQAAHAAQATEAAAAHEWSQGANTRKLDRDQEAVAKADEIARKKREKDELLAQEEAELSKVSGAAKKGGPTATSGKKKNKKKGDLALLEDALQKEADKKVKRQREQQRAATQVSANKSNVDDVDAAAPRVDPLLQNTQRLLPPPADDDVGRDANVARMADGAASGIDAALSSLHVSGNSSNSHEIKSAKALYHAFEARILPIVRQENPGLRLSQLKEKVWALWKKSPENPANHA